MQFQPFTANVIDAGGGHVNLLIDRDADGYPPTGVEVLVSPTMITTDEPAADTADASFAQGFRAGLAIRRASDALALVPIHDHDRMLEHLVDEWGARGVAIMLMDGLTGPDAVPWLDAVAAERGRVTVGRDDFGRLWDVANDEASRCMTGPQYARLQEVARVAAVSLDDQTPSGGWTAGQQINDRETLRGVLKRAHEALCAAGPAVGPLAPSNEHARDAVAHLAAATDAVAGAVTTLGLEVGDTFDPRPGCSPLCAEGHTYRGTCEQQVDADVLAPDEFADEPVMTLRAIQQAILMEAPLETVLSLRLRRALSSLAWHVERSEVETTAAGPDRCCEEGYFGDDHACRKQPGPTAVERPAVALYTVDEVADLLGRSVVSALNASWEAGR